MIDKAAFEAHVRAEAERKYYTQQWTHEDDRRLFSELNAIAEREQAAYIAARMEHEWPLVEALQDSNDEMASAMPYLPAHGQKMALAQINEAKSLLSPYTTKPIER